MFYSQWRKTIFFSYSVFYTKVVDYELEPIYDGKKFALKTYYFIIDFFFTLILIYVQIFKNNTNLYYLQKFISSPFNYQLQIFEKRIDLHEEKNNQENPFISYYFSINTKWNFSRRKILNFFPNSTSLPTIITFFALLFRKR